MGEARDSRRPSLLVAAVIWLSINAQLRIDVSVRHVQLAKANKGLLRELNPGPLAP